MMMDTNQYEQLKHLAERRKSIREFSKDPVSDEDIEKITAVAMTAPYASSRKNWGIEVIRDRETIRKAALSVDEVCSSMARRMRGDFGVQFEQYSKNFTFFSDAPVILVPYFRLSPVVSAMMYKPDPTDQPDPMAPTDQPDDSVLTWERDNYIKSISCVTMMILLAAESLSLGACCVTGALVAEKELCDIFSIKNGRHIGALIPIGHKKGE
jgi:nitroreductase